jgi:hypothetical protein
VPRRLPALQLYAESTDGSFIESKESALVWHYRDADPDFGSWQAKELLDHLEGVLSNEPIEVGGGSSFILIGGPFWLEGGGGDWAQSCALGRTARPRFGARLLARVFGFVRTPYPGFSTFVRL